MFTVSSGAMRSQRRLLSKGEVISAWRWPLWRLSQKEKPVPKEPREGAVLKVKRDKTRTQWCTGRRGRRGRSRRSIRIHEGAEGDQAAGGISGPGSRVVSGASTQPGHRGGMGLG